MKVVLSLFDKRAEMYMQPFFVPAIGVGYRNLMDEIGRGGADNVLASHPEDFQLFQLAQFDEETGWLDVLAAPRLLCDLSDLVDSLSSGEISQAGVRGNGGVRSQPQ